MYNMSIWQNNTHMLHHITIPLTRLATNATHNGIKDLSNRPVRHRHIFVSAISEVYKNIYNICIPWTHLDIHSDNSYSKAIGFSTQVSISPYVVQSDVIRKKLIWL